jgi:MoxR-like ATPase
MLKLKITYPKKDEERQIMERMTSGKEIKVNKITSPAKILNARSVVSEVYIDEKIKNYIVDIIFATRNPEEYGLKDLKNLIAYGASPRATIYLATVAKAYAFIQGRGYVIPEDIKSIGNDVLRHRVIVTYEAEAENTTSEEIIKNIFDHIEVP